MLYRFTQCQCNYINISVHVPVQTDTVISHAADAANAAHPAASENESSSSLSASQPASQIAR